jgi:hypothetical protein
MQTDETSKGSEFKNELYSKITQPIFIKTGALWNKSKCSLNISK